MKNCLVLPAACVGNIRHVALPLLLAALVAPAVEAQISYFNPADITISAPSGSIYFDVDNSGGGILASTSNFSGADFQFSFFEGNSGSPSIQSVGVGDTNRMATGEFTYIPKLSFGQATPDSYNYYAGQNLLRAYNGWVPSSSGYLAFSINGNTPNYGWVQISYNSNSSITLYDFAYEATASTAISAGAIPEPSTYAALFGFAALGFAAYRRRRRQ
jgi:hypothetical protein